MLTVFESAQFGSIRTLTEDGKVLFCGNDVARALGFTRPKDAVRDHCRGAVKRRLPTEGASGNELHPRKRPVPPGIPVRSCRGQCGLRTG